MKRLFIAAVLVLLSTKSYASCAKHKDMAKALLKSGYGFASTAITDQNNVIQLYINTHNGQWVIIGIDDNMNACILVHGLEWFNAIERAI